MRGNGPKYLLCVGGSGLTHTQRLARIARLRISGPENRNNSGISTIAAPGVSLSSGDFRLGARVRFGSSALATAISWRERSREKSPEAARICRKMMRESALSWRRWMKP